MKYVKVEWCENFIRSQFSNRHHPFAGEPDAGIEVNYFWEKALEAGLWEPGVYDGPMSKALEKLVVVESIHNDDGKFLYKVFRLNREVI